MADEILEFLIDEDNEAKFTEHGLTSRQIVQVLDSSHLIVKNRRRRRASHMLIGRDHGGTCIAIPIETTHETPSGVQFRLGHVGHPNTPGW